MPDAQGWTPRGSDVGMILYRQTTASAAAAAISDHAFQDHAGSYLTDREWSGVWFSDRPLDSNEGTSGDTLLEVTIAATESDIQDWEWVEEDKGYREWQIPATILNPLIESIRIVPGE
jgi:hypothetical protein